MSDSSPNPRPVLLYAVLGAAACDDAALHAALDRTGVQEAPLSLLPCGSLSVLASPVPDPDVLRQPDVDQVLAYKEVIEVGYEVRPLLPLRFGTRAESPEAACRLVRNRAEACQKQLAYLEGRVEMGIRLQGSPAADSSPPERDGTVAASGTAYLQARQQAYARTQRPLHRGRQAYSNALEDLCVDVSYDEPDPDDRVLSIAFLVPRRHVDLFRRRATDVEPPSGIQDAQVVGPWPPFTFAL